MLRLIALLIVVALALALYYLPPWGVLLLLLAIAAAAWLSWGFVLKRLFMIPFKMKGRALRGARVEVHSVVPTQAPAKTPLALAGVTDQDGNSEPVDGPLETSDGTPRDYFLVDATITPGPPSGSFTHWEPGELLLVPFDARSKDLEGDENTQVESVEVSEDGVFGPNEGFKYFGPQRLRMLFGIPKGSARRRKFRYYFETFGEILLPDIIDVTHG